eukprot:gb/GFBE01082693.1/.p1 GENE.gb/GFBE01082693.1/~~gb/GFBE01082693.1/.p1  ORF type:complete len:376 (+),score=95.25 gb/GFBE01082693.1/:1-1128(+)
MAMEVAMPDVAPEGKAAAFEVKADSFTGGVSPAVTAFRKAASMVRVSTTSTPAGSGDKKMTPLELDAQLQVSELMYRNLLEGKRVQMDGHKDMDSWYREHLGEAWLKKNQSQKKEMERWAKECGENTPMWVEAVSDSSELACEVFKVGPCGGEQMQTSEEVDRSLVIDYLQSLAPKACISHYARCGVGEKCIGLRAMVGVLWHYPRDPEVLDLCATCLRSTVLLERNRDSLVSLSQPLPPEERASVGHFERGWSFLRIALDAFACQAGGVPVKREAVEATEHDGEWEKVKAEERADPEVAVKLAQCIVATKDAPAMQAQLKLLREPVADDACKEIRDLKEMLPSVVSLTQQLIAKQKGSETLVDLLEMLKSAGAE